MDPFAGRKRRTASERRSQLDGFLERLDAIGATADEQGVVVAEWENTEPEVRERLVGLGDGELRAVLARWREHEQETQQPARAPRTTKKAPAKRTRARKRKAT